MRAVGTRARLAARRSDVRAAAPPHSTLIHDFRTRLASMAITMSIRVQEVTSYFAATTTAVRNGSKQGTPAGLRNTHEADHAKLHGIGCARSRPGQRQFHALWSLVTFSDSTPAC